MGKHIFIRYLVGPSLSISIFYIIMFGFSDFNLYEFNKQISIPWIWLLFYGYGLLSTFVIHWIGKIIWNFTIQKQLLLYGLFGYIIFFLLAPTDFLFVVFAGTVGAFFSILFWIGERFLTPLKWYSWLVFIVPFTCLMMIPMDFTSKVGWHEVQQDDVISVEYDYFNGGHMIPIYGEQGEKVFFKIDHRMSTYKSYGMSVSGAQEESDNTFSITFEEQSMQYILVGVTEGKNGVFRVKWWKET